MRLARLLLFAAALAGVCSAKTYVFKLYGEEQGLRNFAILNILQDKTGYIWTSTENGIFRYDGRRFIEYREGLPPARLDTLYLSPKGVVWAGGVRGHFPPGRRQIRTSLPERHPECSRSRERTGNCSRQ
jgi:ligand-binding sensor domain-containing protein